MKIDAHTFNQSCFTKANCSLHLKVFSTSQSAYIHICKTFILGNQESNFRILSFDYDRCYLWRSILKSGKSKLRGSFLRFVKFNNAFCMLSISSFTRYWRIWRYIPFRWVRTLLWGPVVHVKSSLCYTYGECNLYLAKVCRTSPNHGREWLNSVILLGRCLQNHNAFRNCLACDYYYIT